MELLQKLLQNKSRLWLFDQDCLYAKEQCLLQQARLAQSVEHETLNLRVVGSSPKLG